MRDKAIIITAPSGAGKTTLVRHLLKRYPIIQFSVSACTRPQRSGEVNGVDYYFLTENEFKKKIEEGAFAEWEEVYPGNYYGTLKSEIQRIWNNEKAIIFDVDVKGALTLKQYFGEKGLSLFIVPPSLDELKMRLEGRATESKEKIEIRVKKAFSEMQFQDSFDEKIINDELDKAFAKAGLLVKYFLFNNP